MNYQLYEHNNWLTLFGWQFPVQQAFLIFGFIVFCFWIAKENKTRKIGLSQKDLGVLCLWLIFCALAGGRLYYFLSNFHGWSTCVSLFNLWTPGLTSFGMIIGGVFGLYSFFYWYGKKHKKKLFYSFVDTAALATLLWMFIYRISSFPHGSVPGTETSLPWGVFALNYQQHTGLIIHPTALYLSFAALLTFIFLHWYRTKKKFDGEIAVLFLVCFGLYRFLLEFFRNDGLGFPSPSQVPAMIIFVVGCLLYL